MELDKMKIVYVITKSAWGGAQVHLFDLINDRIANGDDVSLIVGEKGELTRRLEASGCNIVILPVLQRNLSLIKDFLSIIRLRKILKKLNPEILHLHSSKAGSIGRIAGIGLKCKVIFTAHGWAFTEGVSLKKRYVFGKIEKFLARFTDYIICVSKYDYKLAEKIGLFDQCNGKAIQNGVKVPELYTKPQNNIPYLSMTARFDNPKNQELLIESLSLLPKSIKYEFHFIGNGQNYTKCKNMVSKYRLEDRVYFEGFQENVSEFLIKSDINVLISNYEGLPLGLIEAMSYENAIVASDVGGISELTDNKKNGILLTNDVTEIANELNKLLSDTNLIGDYGKKSKAKFEKDFSLSRELNEINDVYLKLVKE